ncbi:MAG TPA: rhombosortase [Lacunisphaera sp.]|nr:rhombosortase [Lacunisphaera sp.]
MNQPASNPPALDIPHLLRHPPPLVLLVALASLIVQLFPEWRPTLVYDRADIAAGQFWRIWTGHVVHFGWAHLFVDAGLLLIVGWISENQHPWFTRIGLVAMPAFISGCMFWLEPGMARYGGLSAFNLGVLLYIAAQGWRRDWTDWFWPAVIAIYVGEIIFEYYRGGQGGGAIRFDDPDVHVATGAHLAAAVYVVGALAMARLTRRPAKT